MNHFDSDPNEEHPMDEQTQRLDLDAPVDGSRHNTWRHPVNTGHLVMGIAFAGLVIVWALITGDVVADDDIRWLLPIPWVAAGAIGLAAATITSLRSRNSDSSA